MASPSNDQTEILKEVLGALKTLQINQVQLASNVDAISGRVNVLAGMKEVREVGGSNALNVSSQSPATSSIVEELHVHEDVKIPESPSLPAAELGSDVSASHARKPSIGTSRIILT